MKWPNLFNKPPKDDNQNLIDHYKELRKAALQLNMKLVKQLPKVIVPECGKKLGLFKAGTLILNNDDEIAILYDYAIYHYRRAGKNIIERHLEQSPPPSDSTEMEILQAMSASFYSIFKVLEILPNHTINLHDVLNDQVINLLDLSLSETGYLGLILAGRVMPFAGFNISTGTLIPLPESVYEQKIVPIVRKFLKTYEPGHKPVLSHGQEAAFVAEIIRVSLHEGGADNIFYTDIEP